MKITTLVCPLTHCSCEGLIRIGDRVRLHSGDYDLETPVEGVGGLLGTAILAHSQEWDTDCLEWHQPRLKAQEIARQLRMALLNDDADHNLEQRLKALSKDYKTFPTMVVSQICTVLEALDNETAS